MAQKKTDSSYVEILAIKESYKRGHTTVVPYFDDNLQRFDLPRYDPEDLSSEPERLIIEGKRREDKRDGVFYTATVDDVELNSHKAFRLDHGMKLDRNNKRDKLMLDIFFASGWIARNFSSVNPAIHRYYLSDEQADARLTTKRADAVLIALQMVGKMTAKDKLDYCFLENANAKHFSSEQIDAFVKEKALSDPYSMIKQLNNGMWRMRAFLHMAEIWGVVKKSGEAFKFGDEIIGLDEEIAINFLASPRGESMGLAIRDALVQRGALSGGDKLPAPKKGAAKKTAELATAGENGGQEEDQE